METILIPLLRMASPFVFVGLAIIAHMYIEDNKRVHSDKGMFLWVLVYLFGAVAIYLFFFAGIYNIFEFNPGEQTRIFAP